MTCSGVCQEAKVGEIINEKRISSLYLYVMRQRQPRKFFIKLVYLFRRRPKFINLDVKMYNQASAILSDKAQTSIVVKVHVL